MQPGMAAAGRPGHVQETHVRLAEAEVLRPRHRALQIVHSRPLAVSQRETPFPCFALVSFTMLYFGLLCHALLWSPLPCFALVSFAMLYFGLLCHALLWSPLTCFILVSLEVALLVQSCTRCGRASSILYMLPDVAVLVESCTRCGRASSILDMLPDVAVLVQSCTRCGRASSILYPMWPC